MVLRKSDRKGLAKRNEFNSVSISIYPLYYRDYLDCQDLKEPGTALQVREERR